MKLAIMTKSTFFVEEDKILAALFDVGLDNLHLYKPETSPIYSERLLSLLPDKAYEKIFVHGHYYLKDEYRLAGIHLDNAAESVPEGYKGKGSTFWFTIPYKPKEAQKENNLTLMPLLNERSKEKPIILIAEDNESNYMLFKSILQKDYELVHAWDGEEAVELHQKFHPHVVIMDINMPKMDGYEATREIRKVSKTVPIIAVTAYSFASDKEKIMQNGFNGYMSKPVDIQRLKEKLDYTIHGNFMMM